jgi:hypothetical protein
MKNTDDLLRGKPYSTTQICTLTPASNTTLLQQKKKKRNIHTESRNIYMPNKNTNIKAKSTKSIIYLLFVWTLNWVSKLKFQCDGRD